MYTIRTKHLFPVFDDAPKRVHGLYTFSLSCVLMIAIYGGMALGQFLFVVNAAAQMDQDQINDAIQDPDIPWNLEADEIHYNQEADEYIARGNVLIYKGNIRLLADYVRFDHKNMQAYAEGDVILTNGLDILNGTSIDIDLESQIGTVENGYLFIEKNNYHITGDLIKKVGENTYTIDQATLTTCDGEKPDWKLTGKKVKIKDDGGGSARHVTMYARKMPVLYTPYFYYPARKDRQTGLLWPQGGYSDRWGTNYNQPFFWAIDKSSDATIYYQYMNFRNSRLGLEYRYYWDKYSKGTWQIDGFDDKQIDDGEGDNSERWGFEDGTDDILRQNEDRYWIRGSHRQKLPYGIRGFLDVDIVSDQDYTREFKEGHMSWADAKEYFDKEFNRDLDDFNDPIRTTRLNLNKIWPRYSLNAQLRYDLDSTIRNSHLPDETLQQLPLIEFDAVKQRISTSPLFYNLNSEYIYYWSVDGKRTQRIDLFPRFFLPLQFKPFITLEPSVGLRGTFWRVDKEEYGPEDRKYYDRELFDTRLDLFSELYSVYNIKRSNIDSIKHTIRPRIVHEFIPEVGQDDLPNFDSVDRIDNQNLLTYSLINRLTSKTLKEGTFEIDRRIDETRQTVIDSPGETNYSDFLRFKLEQSYDIKEATQSDSDRPFSPIFAELDIFPGKYFSADIDALWSVYDWKFLSHNIAAIFWDLRGDRLRVEYRFTTDSDEIDLNQAESIFGDLRVKVTDRLFLSANYEHNFLDNTRVQTGLGLFYKAQCWSFDGRIVDRPSFNSTNISYEFTINLFGLGEFGI
ncbi:MAG: LPS assembly protein LptD [Desulfobacterales bacterium]